MNKQYILFIILVFSIPSCSDFLEVEPVSEISTNNFYQTEEDFVNAINATYGSLQPMYGSHLFRLAELRSDNTFLDGDPGGNRQPAADIDFFEVQTANSLLLQFWNESYKGIANSNIVLTRLSTFDFEDPQRKERITGEAYFLRALFYFNLVRVFGDVPLILEEVTDPEQSREHSRRPLEQVYTAILSDLNQAVDLLPASYSGVEVGRATRWAAAALLGKVRLTREDYGAAEATLLDIVNSGTFQLEENYADLFDPGNKNGIESIFEVQFDGSVIGEGSPFVNEFAPRFSITIAPSGRGEGNNQPTDDLIAAYEPGDLRFNASLDTTYLDENGEVVQANYITKFLNGTNIPFQGIDNFPVLRYADVLLMLAEAQFFQNGDGLDYLNAVRGRAGLDDLAALSLEAILQERRVELAFEDHRWFDLVRTGKALEVMNAYLPSAGIGAISIAPFQLIYPVPQAQIDVNPDVLTQNQGYQ